MTSHCSADSNNYNYSFIQNVQHLSRKNTKSSLSVLMSCFLQKSKPLSRRTYKLMGCQELPSINISLAISNLQFGSVWQCWAVGLLGAEFTGREGAMWPLHLELMGETGKSGHLVKLHAGLFFVQEDNHNVQKPIQNFEIAQKLTGNTSLRPMETLLFPSPSQEFHS